MPEAGARPVLDALDAAAARRRPARGRDPGPAASARGWPSPCPSAVGARTDGFLAVGERVGRRRLHGGGPRLRADPGPAGGRRPGDGPPPSRRPREAAARPRDADRARDPAQPLPARPPAASPASRSRRRAWPCYEVGGDHYDFIPLGGERLGPRHRRRVRQGRARQHPHGVRARVAARAGRQRAPGPCSWCGSTGSSSRARRTNRYVTLFYGELDPARRRLGLRQRRARAALLAGRGRRGGRGSASGGPVLGLLESARYEHGARSSSVPATLVAMVTDGATEALSPDDEEFGDDAAARAPRVRGRATAPRRVVRRVSERRPRMGRGPPAAPTISPPRAEGASDGR